MYFKNTVIDQKEFKNYRKERFKIYGKSVRKQFKKRAVEETKKPLKTAVRSKDLYSGIFYSFLYLIPSIWENDTLPLRGKSEKINLSRLGPEEDTKSERFFQRERRKPVIKRKGLFCALSTYGEYGAYGTGRTAASRASLRGVNAPLTLLQNKYPVDFLLFSLKTVEIL